jgi:hypothetical protein
MAGLDALFPQLVGPPGEPVPEVDPDQLKAFWDIYDKIKSRAYGPGASHESPLAVYGRAIIYRCMMLKLLESIPDNAPAEVLRLIAPLRQNGHLVEAAVKVGARFSMTWLPGVGNHPLPYDLAAFVEEVRKEQEV